MSPAPADPHALLGHPAVRRVADTLRAAGLDEAYLVGGAVRDWLLGRGGPAARDLDVAIPGDPGIVAQAAARALGGSVVPLDEATVRVVFPGADGPWRLDIARYRGTTIAEDLALRDLTVDAMALALLGPGPPGLLDPTGGRADLEQRIVRHVYAAAFRDDPLRTLRAVRLAAALDGRIAPETQALIRGAAAGLAGVAGERIRDELIMIFGSWDAARWANQLAGFGLLGVLVPASAEMGRVPPSPPHRHDLWEHSLEALRLLMRLLRDPGAWFPEDADEIARRADEVVEGEIPRRSLLGLFALLHDVGKPSTRTVDPGGRVRFVGHVEAGAAILAALAERLRLGRRAAAHLDRMERGHMRPLWLAAEPAVTPRARYRFFRDLGPVALDVLVHSVADVGATVAREGPAWEAHRRFVADMLAFRRERLLAARGRPPLTGDDVMALLGIGPGPLVGYVLERAAEAVALGPSRPPGEVREMVRRSFPRWRREFEESQHRPGEGGAAPADPPLAPA